MAGDRVAVEIEDDRSDPETFVARFARVASDLLPEPYSTELMRAAATSPIEGVLWVVPRAICSIAAGVRAFASTADDVDGTSASRSGFRVARCLRAAAVARRWVGLADGGTSG
jgi:hypothetical protein